MKKTFPKVRKAVIPAAPVQCLPSPEVYVLASKGRIYGAGKVYLDDQIL